MDVKYQLKQHQVVQEEDGSVNVLICDEFAFLKPSCLGAESIITIKDKKSGKIINYTIEEAYDLINK